MRPEDKGWRGSQRELTAPESYVLVYGPKAGGSRPFKLALMELVAGKCLTLTDAEDGALFRFVEEERRPARARRQASIAG